MKDAIEVAFLTALGREFHKDGAAEEKARSPALDLVRCEEQSGDAGKMI